MSNFYPDYAGTGDIWTADLMRDFTCVKLSVLLSSEYLIEIRTWCEERFGDDWVWSINRYFFKDPQHALLFRLKWSDMIDADTPL